MTAAVTALACCGGPVQGTPIPEGKPAAAHVDVSKLDTGSYPIGPLAPLGVAGDPDAGSKPS